MVHDFKKYPELRNSQMALYYFDSPHKQITESFWAKVKKVTDGDTVRLTWKERDFDFPLRISKIASPELDESNGEESKNWLERIILNEEVYIQIDKNKRVEKWGRLLGEIIHKGINMGDESIRQGFSVLFRNRKDGTISDFNKELEKVKI
jgi:endonuclease YncB( thermonuclease family)